MALNTFRTLTRSCMALLAVAILSVGAPVMAADPPPGANPTTGDNVSLNFSGADIETVIRAIGQISGRNFLVDPRVKGTLNIITNRPVPRALTYSILLSALRLQGFAAVEGNGVTKIMPEADAKLHAVPVSTDRSVVLSGDRLITEVFQIKHESAQQLLQVVRPLVTANNTVTVYPGNNSLVITDYAENIGRIARIIASIDVPPSDSQVIQVQNASAVDLAAMLVKLFPETANNAEPSQRLTILPDSRSNSLLVRSENRSKVQAVRSMVAQLDQPGSITANVRVVYLKNAEATKVAEALRGVITGNSQGSSNGTQPVQQQQQQQPNNPNTPNGNNQPAPQAGVTTISGSGVMVQADPVSNALIITAPEAIYNNLRNVIEQLDRRRAQVYVEALIAEISAERAAEFGIQWQSGIPTAGSTTVFGGTNFGSGGQNILNVAQNPLAASKGLNFVVGGGPITIGGTTIFELNMLARFLESDGRSNILSTPNLVTLDNEEAKIVIGRNVPFVTGQYTNTGGGSSVTNPFQTIERKDVGLTLRIKPHITEGGAIRMEIFQESSSVIESTASSAAGPSTTKRSLESMVIADDGSIIALGGLVEDQYIAGEDKVPLLGDVPVVGSLFRYETRKRNKTNLMIFLRPKILRSESDVRAISQDRYEYVIGSQRQADKPEKLLRNEERLPEMPQLRLAPELQSQPAATPTAPAEPGVIVQPVKP